MIVRPARFRDTKALVSLAAEALERSRYEAVMDVAEAKRLFVACVAGHQSGSHAAPVAFVAERDDRIVGAIVGVIRPLYEVLSINLCTDLFWYVSPGANGRAALDLLDKLHEWARPHVGRVIFAHVVNDSITDPMRVGRLLARRGYRCSGQIFEKMEGNTP